MNTLMINPMMKRFIAVSTLLMAMISPAIQAQETTGMDLYKVSMIRAAPGKMSELISLYKSLKDNSYYQALGEQPPYIMRHSQGDHWDIMLITPLASYDVIYGSKAKATRQSLGEAIKLTQTELNARIDFKEDLYAKGPAHAIVAQLFADNDFYHLEMFSARAGDYDHLKNQRLMENIFLKKIGIHENLIFETEFGSDYDLFTIGFYKNKQDYAKPTGLTPVQENQFAKEAGFQSAGDIGNYLRKFLVRHNDTLAVSVK